MLYRSAEKRKLNLFRRALDKKPNLQRNTTSDFSFRTYSVPSPITLIHVRMNVFTPLVISHLIGAVGAAFLPATSSYRHAVSGIILMNCIVSLQLVDVRAWWGLQYAEYVFGYFLCANNFLCLRKIAPQRGATTAERLRFGFVALFHSRRDIPAKNLPRFSRNNPNYTPPRSKFLLSRVWALTWTMGVLALLQRYPLSLWSDDFETPKTRILRRILDVSPREWIILLYISFESWLNSYCTLDASHSLASIIAVACGDEPKNWKPLFGSIKDAYTVQRFFRSAASPPLSSVIALYMKPKSAIGCFGISFCKEPS